MPDALHEPARAKINLALHITGRRDDGYHLLDSLVVFAEAGDRLSAETADDLSLILTGPYAAGLLAEPDNLVLRAARALAAATGVPAGARLRLDKHLPVASGIGGGSADAAAALRVLCRLWGVTPSQAVLHRIATGLGADVPACLASRPMRMRGVGERLDPLPPLPRCGLVLANPGVALATPPVFQARQGPFSAALPTPHWPDLTTLIAALRGMANDLELPARSLCPPITRVLAALAAQPDCLLARMSGSGATCFALFADRGQAESAAAALDPSWWRHAGLIAA